MSGFTDDYGDATGFGVLLGLVIFISVVVLLVVGIGWVSSFERTKGGEVAVVRNGGLFDNNKIRQFIPEASDRVSTGLWSSTHKYPTQQRFYKISSNAKESDSGDADKVTTPTSNGVNVGIEGTIYFKFNTKQKVIEDFDDKFGTRTFGGKHPYEGNEGISNFLNTIGRPVILSNLRKQIGNVTCADLVSSCALVQNEGNLKAVAKNKGKLNNARLDTIEESVNKGLQTDIHNTLGGDYLTDIKFSITRVVLPPKVEGAVEDAQAAFGRITQAEAKRQQAELDAEANKIKQRGYQDCPACAQIDALKSIPKSITTFAPGSGFAVTPK